ncbi:hypothetical protein Dsin_009274 [Dipteronia sinensis]|uniref:Uncharacterized protein n=1 Tax=Dipteronia sinensis TaxID=43782 RepID=A0AAE0EBS3_9ROSI|nr:hypothetical protein Dsin_009274 [Dipteronia sinensis]
MVATRNWVGYVERPPWPNMRVVAESYSSIIPERFINGGVVLVQGVAVYITPDAITQYFAAPDVQVNDDRGIEWIEVIGQYQGRLAAVLRMDGQEEWNQLASIEEVRSIVSWFSVASGSGAHFQTSAPESDFHAGGGSGFYQQDFRYGTPKMHYHDEEQRDPDLDQGTGVLHFSDEDGGS